MNPLLASPIMDLIGRLFQPVADLIDNLHTSKEEKLEARQKMFDAQAALSMRVLDYEAQLLQMQGNIVNSEANSEHWLAAVWRPVTMLTFLAMIVGDVYGFAASPLPPEIWTLIQLGLGGYVVGRSAEKIAGTVTDVMASKR